MELNSTVIIIFIVVVAGFFVLYFIRNRKDKKELEEQIENDYSKEAREDIRSEKGTEGNSAI